jgi:hypothetical protein
MRTSQRQGLKKAGVVVLVAWSGLSQSAEDSAFRTLGPSLQSYEPNLIGYTWASEDTGFVDLRKRYAMHRTRASRSILSGAAGTIWSSTGAMSSLTVPAIAGQ